LIDKVLLIAPSGIEIYEALAACLIDKVLLIAPSGIEMFFGQS